jgi:AbrB family looped-hinge helix DNA binding protein
MKTTIDSAGRLVIPKEIRRQANLEPGAALEIRVREGRIEIEPALVPMRLERRGRLTVLVPEAPLPPMDAGLVERIREQILDERGRIT